MHARDIDSTFVPRQANAAFTVELDGEAVILDEARNRMHHLNVTASLLWACFDGSGSIEEIARDLAAAYGASDATTVADVLTLARELGAEGLLAGVDHDPDEVDHDPDEVDRRR